VVFQINLSTFLFVVIPERVYRESNLTLDSRFRGNDSHGSVCQSTYLKTTQKMQNPLCAMWRRGEGDLPNSRTSIKCKINRPKKQASIDQGQSQAGDHEDRPYGTTHNRVEYGASFETASQKRLR